MSVFLEIASPFLAAVLLALLPPIRRRPPVAFALGALGIVGAITGFARAPVDQTLLSFAWFGPFQAGWFRFALLPHTQLIGLITSAVAFCIVIFARWYMASEKPGAYGRFSFLITLFVGAMMLMIASRNLLSFYIFWEIMGFCSYALIGFWYKKASASRAALKAFWTTRIGDLGFLFALVMLVKNGVGLDFEQVNWWLLHAPGHQSWYVFGGLFLAVMGKSAQFPLYIWLPDAMEGPTPVSAMIHAATMVCAGVILLLNLAPAMAQFGELVMLVGGITALLAALQAVVAWDIKKVLAYSTISQLGYMVAAAGAGSITAGTHHLTAHAGFKALLFLAAGVVLHTLHEQRLGKTGSVYKRMPLVGLAFVVGTLSLAGIWPLSGFFSKDAVLIAVSHRSQATLILLLAGVLGTGLYSGRLLRWLAKPGKEDKVPLPLAVQFPLAALILLTLGYGILALPVAVVSPHEAAGFLPLVALALACVGLLVGWLGAEASFLAEDRLPARIAASNYGLDPLATFLVRNVLLLSGKTIAWTDRYVVDGVLNRLATRIQDLGQGVVRQEPDTAVRFLRMMVAGLIVLLTGILFGGLG